MNILMNIWSYFATNILQQPAFMIGLIVMLGYILLKKPWYDVLAGVIRGSGNAVVPMGISLANMCVVRIIWLMIATSIWDDFSVVVISYPLTWSLASLCYLIYYLKGGWMKKWKEQQAAS